MFNKSIKKIFLNFSLRTFGNILSKTLGFISLPFISRAIGPEGYGSYSFIVTLITYTALFVEWGYIPYGIRETAKQSDSSSVVNTIITTKFTFGIISILLGLFVFSFIYWNNWPFLLNIFIGFGFTISQIINIDYYYFGKKQMLIPTAARLTGQIIFVIGVALFIRTPEDFTLLMVLYVSYQFIGSLIGLLLYIYKQTIKIKFSLKTAFSTFKTTFNLGLSSRIEQLITTYPILIIPLFFSSNYELGIYNSAFKFFTIIIIVYQTAMLALAPYLVSLKSKAIDIQRQTFLKILRILLSIGITSSIVIFLTDKYIVKLLFGSGFTHAIPLIDLISYFLLPFWPITMILGNILIYYNYDKYYLRATFANAFLILLSTPILVYFFGVSGAIYAIGIGNFAVIIISFYYIKKLIPNLLLPLHQNIKT